MGGARAGAVACETVRAALATLVLSPDPQAIEGRYSGLRVTYGRYGVPAAIALDPQSRVADEETSYAIRRFQRR